MSFFGDIGDFFGGVGGDIVGAIATGGLSVPWHLAGGSKFGPGGDLLDSIFGSGPQLKLPTLPAPPPPADPTDEAVRLASLAQRRRLMMGQGVGSSFISGSLGDVSQVTASTSKAGGY